MLENLFSPQLFSRLVNAALALHPELKNKLAALDGRRISILLEWCESPWILAIENGEIALPADHDSACDIRLTGNLAGLLQLFQPSEGGKRQGKLYIEGDLYAAQQFQKVMAELKPDFEAILKRRFGERLGTRLADEARRLQETGIIVKETLSEKLETFCSAQAVTRADNQAFAARLQKLTARLAAAEKILASVGQK